MNREIVELREVVTKLVPLLTGKGLAVTQRGSQAYVRSDPRTKKPIQVNIPNIPDTATPDFIRAIQGFIDHEVGHVLITDWHYYGGENLKPKDMMDPKIQRLIGYHNIVEDTMIEPGMVRIFPGSRKNIHDLREHFIARITKPAVEAAKDDKERFNYLLVPVMRSLAGHQEFTEYLDAEKHWDNPYVKELVDKLSPATKKSLPKLRTTKQTLAVARELDAILHPPAPQMPSPPSQCQSQDKPDKEAGEGDGDGERDHQDKDEEGQEQESDDKKGEGASASDEEKDDDNEGDEEEEGDGFAEAEDDDAGDEEDQDGDAGSSDEDGDDEESSDDDGSGDDDEDAGDDGEQNDGDEENDQGEDGAEGDDEGAGDDDGEKSSGEGGDGSDDEDSSSEGSSSGGDEEDGDDADGSTSEDGELEDEEGNGKDGGLKEEGGNHRLAIQTDDHDIGRVGEAEDSDDQGGGVGNGLSKSLFDFEDDAFKNADLSSQITVLIENEAVDLMGENDYNVYTREFDRIEVLDPPENIEPSWIPKLDDETRQMTGRMQKDIERMMASQSHVVRVPGFRSGRLHAPSLHRLLVNDDRVFHRKQEHKSKDTAVTLLIDNSGSMYGAKCRTAMVAAYALSTTLERVNIVNEVLGFTTGDFKGVSRSVQQAMNEEISKGWYQGGVKYHRTTPIMMPIYKTFDERVTPEVKKRMAYMANAQNGMASNVDGESLEYAALRIMKRREKRKVILVLSDGQPSGGQNVGPHLKMTVEKLMKMGIDLVGIGIMDNAVQRFYPKHVVLNNVADLPTEIMQELKQILTA